MADVTLEMIKELRERTQASLADVKKVLEETEGDIEEAAKQLRVRGAAIAQKRGDRAANAGTVDAYIHSNGKVGVLIDLRSETDFVANTDEFKALAHDLALHIAAAAPRYVAPEDIPDEVVAEEKRLISEQYADSGKPADIIEKIVDGKVRSLGEEIALLPQTFVKNPDKTIQDVLDEAVAKFGEKITVARFERFVVGE